MHPDTNGIHYVSVGSALFHISAMHDLIFVPNSEYIMKQLPNVCCEYWGDNWHVKLPGNKYYIGVSLAEILADGWLYWMDLKSKNHVKP
jgi:hypothetical protein